MGTAVLISASSSTLAFVAGVGSLVVTFMVLSLMAQMMWHSLPAILSRTTFLIALSCTIRRWRLPALWVKYLDYALGSELPALCDTVGRVFAPLAPILFGVAVQVKFNVQLPANMAGIISILFTEESLFDFGPTLSAAYLLSLRAVLSVFSPSSSVLVMFVRLGPGSTYMNMIPVYISVSGSSLAEVAEICFMGTGLSLGWVTG
ncbi:hypothetical protein C7212DRAFT_345471 [Tuber magnatum]|uniref:Uncharacterized protein n=1 Tax=Tuber magnatum TaxID=42249 RepID=A0A317SLB7_9PEZI|nr:hypothetical protein C7212DRAFT_345471 [Tuber magnatum]